MSTTITAAAATGSAVSGAAGGNAIGSDPTEDRFLKLLIAQMKNQDPLNPLDNAQVTSQMAQISAVQGIAQLNASVTSMTGQIQGAQAIALTGHQVLVDGSSLTLAPTTAGLSARGGFDLSQDAERVSIEVKDAKGNVIAQLNLGAQAAGPGAFDWDGKLGNGTAAPGTYTFEVKAYNGTVAVPAGALTAARVEGATITPSGVRLTLEGLGSRYYSDIRMVM
jgi:flagellar basal-body rod modification protein FlgD